MALLIFFNFLDDRQGGWITEYKFDNCEIELRLRIAYTHRRVNHLHHSWKGTGQGLKPKQIGRRGIPKPLGYRYILETP